VVFPNRGPEKTTVVLAKKPWLGKDNTHTQTITLFAYRNSFVLHGRQHAMEARHSVCLERWGGYAGIAI
jgi:hypothetical protein